MKPAIYIGLLLFFYVSVLANIAGGALAYTDGHTDLIPLAFGAMFLTSSALFVTGLIGVLRLSRR